MTTKSFQNVVKSNPYPGIVITKFECVGHVQKRVGKRLRDLKLRYNGIRLKDNKFIGGGGGGGHLNYPVKLNFLKCRFHDASLCCLGAYGKICCAHPIVQKHILTL